MNARNQLLVVLTALMVVSSGGAMVAAATGGDTVEQGDNVSEDEYEGTDIESADESVAESQDRSETATGLEDNASDDGELEPDTDSDGNQAAYVTFNDQAIDNDTVVVENATLASGGFVAIHDSSLLVGNVVDSVIGSSTYLEAGTHENIEITLDEPLEEDETLIAMPHRDTNDNETYDFVETDGQADGPYLTADNEPVTDDAEITVDGVADEAPVDEEPVDNETDELPVEEEPVDEEPVDNETDEEPVDEEPVDNETDELPVEEEPVDEEPVDNETDEEPVDEEPLDNETDDEPVVEEPVEEEPVEDEPMDQLPIDADNRPVFVTVENLTVEDLNAENTSVYVLVVGDDIDTDDLPDEIDNITEEPIVDDTDDELLDNETDDEDEVPVDDDTDDEPLDNETDDEDEVPVDDDTDDNGLFGDETDNETDDDDAADDVTAEAFEVSDLEAPESATVGENITVTATVENPSDEERTESVQFRLEGDLVAEQNVTLDSGESDDVEFEVETSALQAGSYIHMILTDEAGEVAILELIDEIDTDEDVDSIDDETDDELNETDNLDDTDEIDDDNETNDTDDGLTA
ncbi:DUF7282 domain-containing protein [Natrinema gari]|uniref:DUF7282 domain-containing protein n=1 Tax=Natrinema gari JCM 14663 TaxID=1230459 RepID=L9ZAK8_9EURY|nr:hypothetical protein [Natrinema gari]ELY83021.1 hypothetical protein C486_04059 [Natrinema gari JCM 14663]